MRAPVRCAPTDGAYRNNDRISIARIGRGIIEAELVAAIPVTLSPFARCRIRTCDPLPCESAQGSRQTYTNLIKSSQSLETTKPERSDLWHHLALFFRGWVQV